MKCVCAAILKKFPWSHIVMFLVCLSGFYHYVPEGGFIFDDNAYAAAFVGVCSCILWDLVITLSLDFFDKKRSLRSVAASEVSGNE